MKMGRVKRELFEPTQDVFEEVNNNNWKLYEEFERAEQELRLAFDGWKTLRDKINKKFQH